MFCTLRVYVNKEFPATLAGAILLTSRFAPSTTRVTLALLLFVTLSDVEELVVAVFS